MHRHIIVRIFLRLDPSEQRNAYFMKDWTFGAAVDDDLS
jgi:hypothetical protein